MTLSVFTVCLSFSGCQQVMEMLGMTHTYTVTFDSQSADTLATPTSKVVTTPATTIDVLPIAPIKSGYIFGGWFTATNGGGRAFTTNTEVSADVTVYANWIAISYTVAFDSQSATTSANPSSKTVTSPETTVVTLPTAPVKTGYTFDGWYTAIDGAGTAFFANTTVTADIAVYAKWLSLPTTFRAQRMTDGTWYDVPATCKASGTHCLVYVATNSTVSTSTASAIANEFDNNIYTKIQSNFGVEADVDSNGKIILLLLDIIDGYSGSGGYVAGSFDPTHEFSKATFTNSNEADMLFIDVYPAVPGSANFYSTIAHEFQHLINFSCTYLVNGTSQETWINEGLSSGAEYIYSGSQRQNRIDYYNADPAGTIIYGNNFFVWNGYWENNGTKDLLANYATVYLFFQWLQIHASNGIGVYKDILNSSYRDYRTVTSAASSRISSSFGTWSTLLRTWMEANLINKLTGFQGYNGLIATSTHILSSSNNYQWYFSPGEGIAALTTGGTFTPNGGSGTNVSYVGLSAAGTEDTSSPYVGVAVLTYNANPSISGADEIGFVSDIVQSLFTSPSYRSISPTEALPTSFPIDVSLMAGGGFDASSHVQNVATVATGKSTFLHKGLK
jgi:uncharacterized repeat protein (TIGR02543 family)